MRSSCPRDLGRSPASRGQSSHPASTGVVERELLSQQLSQLGAEVASLRECVDHLVWLLDSNHKEDLRNFQELRESIGRDQLSTKGEDNRVDFLQHKQQQLEQEQKQQQEEQGTTTQGELDQLPKKKRQRNRKKKKQQVAWEQTSYNNSLRTSSSLGTIQEEETMESLQEESLSDGSSEQLWWILVDTGAELSVAPRSFAPEMVLSPHKNDLQLRTADGRAIQTFGLRTAQLLSQGISFTMTFVIADVEVPLLGLSSLLQENLCLQLHCQLGHQLVTSQGERMQLVQQGNQVYLPAYPRQLHSTSFMVGNLQYNSLLPEDELEESTCNLGQHKEVHNEGGVAEEPSFTLELAHQKQQENKTAIGQQQPALPKLRRTQNKEGQYQVRSKLRTWKQTRYMKKMQLALLDDKRTLEAHASKDLSLKIILIMSLMNKWQLSTTRIQTALPQQLRIGHLKELGLIQSKVNFEIFHGVQLCVFCHDSCILIGGTKDQQECFINKLSAKIPLTDTTQLDEETSLTFMGKSLKYTQAKRGISLSLPRAFYQELLCRYDLADATALETPMQELDPAASRCSTAILDACRSQLYRKTVGDLVESSLIRPDISFALSCLSKSVKQPTAQDEAQLRNLLKYLLGTQQYSLSLQPPRHWERAKNLDLLAFSAVSWQGACDFMIGSSLSFMGISLAASTMLQATTRTRAELASVDMACTLACHTKSLLHELDLGSALFLRVLVGGPLARQLGLSNKHRHMDLRCRLGQFQLSKVLSNKNLAEQLADNLRASDLHRLLAKLQIHHQPAEMLALSTSLGGEEVAFFQTSSSSFYIGVLSLQPSMSQLDLAQLEQIAMAELRRTALNTELQGKELVKPHKIPMLESALCREPVEKPALERTALQMNLDSLLRKSLRKEELTAERACPLRAQSFTAKPDEGWRALAYNCAALIQTAFRNQLREHELDKKNNIPQLHLQLYPSTVQGGALKSSSRKQLRMTSSHSLS